MRSLTMHQTHVDTQKNKFDSDFENRRQILQGKCEPRWAYSKNQGEHFSMSLWIGWDNKTYMRGKKN